MFVARDLLNYFKRPKITCLRELQFPDNDIALYMQKTLTFATYMKKIDGGFDYII